MGGVRMRCALILLCGVDSDGNHAPGFIGRVRGCEGLSTTKLRRGSRSSPPPKQGASPGRPS